MISRVNGEFHFDESVSEVMGLVRAAISRRGVTGQARLTERLVPK